MHLIFAPLEIQQPGCVLLEVVVSQQITMEKLTTALAGSRPLDFSV